MADTANIDLGLGDLTTIDTIRFPFALLFNACLQPGSFETAEDTTQRILNVFGNPQAHNLPQAYNVIGAAGHSRVSPAVARFSIDVSKMIQWLQPDHPSQAKLVDICAAVSSSEEWITGGGTGGPNQEDFLFPRALWKSIGGFPRFTIPGENKPAFWESVIRNTNDFSAKIGKILYGDQRDFQEPLEEIARALEGAMSDDAAIYDASVLCAANYMISNGETVFDLVCEARVVGDIPSGRLWIRHWHWSFTDSSKAAYCAMSWEFWKERFRATAAGERGDEYDSAQITKDRCVAAVERMDHWDGSGET